MRSLATRHHQQGAVVVTVALVLLFLLGMMGITLNFGRLFIVKTELQTAMDSCALAAAQELDRQDTAIDRAKSAGLSAGNLNNVNLQSASWDSQGKLVGPEVTFRDANYVATIVPANARYAECRHSQPNIRMWLLQALGTVWAGTVPTTQNVAAFAVATRASAQTTCPIPVAMKPKPGGTAPNYGFVVGEWVTLIMEQGGAVGGEIGWANLDGSNNADETRDEMISSCGTKVGDTVGTPGVQTSVADAWNYRFGIYGSLGPKGAPNNGPTIHHPDFTGYSYTSQNWLSGQNAYNGAAVAEPTGTAQNFLTKRLSFASCADTGTSVSGANSCESITGLTLNSFQNLAAPGNVTGGHKQYGASRRIVTVPVVNGAKAVIDYACMLMLQPLSIPMTNTQLEFLGNAGAINTPCTTSGLPGGSAGPLVPVLVR